MRQLLVFAAVLLTTTQLPSRVLVLRSTGGLPAHIADSFEKPLGFQQSDTGQYFVFDRRAHAVFTVANDAAKKVTEVGAEPGRIIDPSAFDIDPKDGTFVFLHAPDHTTP